LEEEMGDEGRSTAEGDDSQEESSPKGVVSGGDFIFGNVGVPPTVGR
jgi:hypothetical protein